MLAVFQIRSWWFLSVAYYFFLTPGYCYSPGDIFNKHFPWLSVLNLKKNELFEFAQTKVAPREIYSLL